MIDFALFIREVEGLEMIERGELDANSLAPSVSVSGPVFTREAEASGSLSCGSYRSSKR